MCNKEEGQCNEEHPNACQCSERRVPRQLQPLMLLVLKGKDSYGYQLIEKISELGFHDTPPDVGAVYRTLRAMEKERWVNSKWDTSGNGPAKRIYRITPQGEEILHGWAITLQKRKTSLEDFLDLYRSYYGKGGRTKAPKPSTVIRRNLRQDRAPAKKS